MKKVKRNCEGCKAETKNVFCITCRWALGLSLTELPGRIDFPTRKRLKEIRYNYDGLVGDRYKITESRLSARKRMRKQLLKLAPNKEALAMYLKK